MDQFEILDNWDSLAAAFDRIVVEVGDMDVPIRRTLEYLQDETVDSMNTDGDRAGGWVPLNPRYEEWKIAKVGYKPILQLTAPEPGSLLNAVADPDAIDVHDDHGTYTIDHYLAPIHQEGREPKWDSVNQQYSGGMPARPILVEVPEDREEIEAIWWEWFDFVATHVKVEGYERGGKYVPGYYRSYPGFKGF